MDVLERDSRWTSKSFVMRGNVSEEGSEEGEEVWSNVSEEIESQNDLM